MWNHLCGRAEWEGPLHEWPRWESELSGEMSVQRVARWWLSEPSGAKNLSTWGAWVTVLAMGSQDSMLHADTNTGSMLGGPLKHCYRIFYTNCRIPYLRWSVAGITGQYYRDGRCSCTGHIGLKCSAVLSSDHQPFTWRKDVISQTKYLNRPRGPGSEKPPNTGVSRLSILNPLALHQDLMLKSICLISTCTFKSFSNTPLKGEWG